MLTRAKRCDKREHSPSVLCAPRYTCKASVYETATDASGGYDCGDVDREIKVDLSLFPRRQLNRQNWRLHAENKS